MSRFLFVVPPLADRAGPARSVAHELERRGHDVAWTGLDDRFPDGVPDSSVPPLGGLRSPAGVLVLWDDYLLPLARDMLPVVRSAASRFAPDLLVVDDHALAGAAVGLLAGLPWATLVPTSAGLTDPLWDLPALARLVRCRTRHFLRDAGVDDSTAAMIDPRRSPHLVIAFSTEALAGPVDDPAGRHAFVGPLLSPAPDDVPFDRDRLRLRDDRPLVVVTMATPLPRSGHIYRVATEALADLDVQGVVLGPVDVLGDVLGALPPDVVVAPEASLRSLVRHASAVVCDAGHATVCKALAHGVPLVVAPMTADQPLLAEQVVHAGAAVPVNATHSDATRVADAIRAILTDRQIHDHARTIADSFHHPAGPPAAATRLESLLSDVP